MSNVTLWLFICPYVDFWCARICLLFKLCNFWNQENVRNVAINCNNPVVQNLTHRANNLNYWVCLYVGQLHIASPCKSVLWVLRALLHHWSEEYLSKSLWFNMLTCFHFNIFLYLINALYESKFFSHVLSEPHVNFS